MKRLIIWLFNFLFFFFHYQSVCSSPLSSSPPANHSCPLDERSSLLQFKQMFRILASSRCDKLGSTSYPKTLSWNETTDCCSWDGVTCDVSTGHVIGLDLSCSNLYGIIHPNTTLFQLSHLQQLNLASNNFNFSPIPPSFSRFTSLSHLNLAHSSLSGSIPSEIAHLSKLVSLDLSTFDGRLRLEPHNFKMLLGNLTQLQELVLEGVNISSRLPDSLVNLSSLATVDLTETGLLGDLPYGIFQLPKLQKLYLGGSYHITGNLLGVKWSSNSSLEQLVLRETLMSGRLPDSIGHLRVLNYLDLFGNQFSGPLPESLGNLTRITELNVNTNNLNGAIPDSFAKLLKLEGLELGNNNFTGPFPGSLANLTQLVWLRISYNALTGPISSNIIGFRNLQMLHLFKNSIHGTLPSWLFTIPSLNTLDLSFNQLTGPIPEFRGDSPLEVIDFRNNKLHGPIPQSISGLVNLRFLDLQSNTLNGFLELQKLPNLQDLFLSENNISVSIGSNANATLPSLSSLRMSYCNITEFPHFLQNTSGNLEDLDLSNNKIHGEIPKWVEGAPLSLLDLSHNYLYGEIPSSICNLSSLYLLVLSNNNLTGVIPQCLGIFSNELLFLDLRMNGFHGAIPTTFANGSKLMSVNLYGNHLQGPIPRSLANCKSLAVLDLGNNNLSGSFPHWLESLPELQVLVLKSNRFHGPIGTSGSGTFFPMLRIFDLSHNNFTGLLPLLNFKAMMNVNKSKISSPYMGSSVYDDSVDLVLKGVEIELEYIHKFFTIIDFSCNNFIGEIPNDIGKLQGLRLLNLSHNSLSGHLPSLLRNITMLESLDLSSNQLTGEIPGELTSLTFLAVLNFSKNHLVGPIPHGKQFDTFQNDSYIGNSGLCGLPLSKRCGDSQEQPISQDDDDDDDDFASGFTWRIVLMGFGCGFVIGATIGFVMFLIGRPRWYTGIVREEPRRKVVRVRQIGSHQR